MMGRTYSIGYEPNLEDWLLDRPRKVVTDSEWKWYVWYPLRRKGEFNSLPQDEQMTILREHGKIGRGFGEAGLAHDIRLASFRHGSERQRLRHRFDRQGIVSAVRVYSGDAQDAADLAPHAGDGTLLYRQSNLAEGLSVAHRVLKMSLSVTPSRSWLG